jgi:5-methylcytosine-specific restriction endonuclease McrA
VNKPDLVYHADWSRCAHNRWCARAVLGADGRYSASEPAPVGDLNSLLKSLKADVGEAGTVFAGFDFPIGVPVHFAERAGIAKFRQFLAQLGTGVWKDFYSVCEKPEEISVHRPFYPNQSKKGCSQQQLLDAHYAETMRGLLRDCERGGDGQRQACSLFWTLGANAVGKAALMGWEHVLVPAHQDDSVLLWPFDGKMESLFEPGRTVIAETYPAECYSWFPGEPLEGKTSLDSRKRFGKNLLSWAQESDVGIEPRLRDAIEAGFPDGEDDAFDAAVGLFGMLQVCLCERDSGEPEDETIRNVEGWILGRKLRTATTGPVGTMPKFGDSLRGYAFSIHQRDHFCCRYCGLDGTTSFQNWTSLSWDHLLPKDDPRRDNPDFIVTACMFCNTADNRYFGQAVARNLKFENISPDDLVKQRQPFVLRTRNSYKTFWEERVRNASVTSQPLSAATDPELADWLRWASESGEVPNFIRAIAEAAFLADLPNYALLRPILLKLKSESPETPDAPTMSAETHS